ncbi:hypothetical protein [Clostridium sp. DJ247]|uniref:hypothetical protein n=1 Tax=Clostridium sp. DJ247 TaxID=2726188 RepID=UPI001625C8FC|nr:hypothetical protein [Clostridium sp. DJ247]MBC2581356.1 hypothetical protein [Clostridium sp. DJ247]
MKFKELPKEVQNYVLSCTILIDKLEMSFQDGLIQDNYNIEKRIELCSEKFNKMKNTLG